jgi:predicted sugar kinase
MVTRKYEISMLTKRFDIKACVHTQVVTLLLKNCGLGCGTGKLTTCKHVLACYFFLLTAQEISRTMGQYLISVLSVDEVQSSSLLLALLPDPLKTTL